MRARSPSSLSLPETRMIFTLGEGKKQAKRELIWTVVENCSSECVTYGKCKEDETRENEFMKIKTNHRRGLPNECVYR